MMRNTRLIGLFLVLPLCWGLLTGCGNANTMRIGTQTFTETKVLAYMYKLLIEDRTKVKVDVLTDLASSSVVLDMLKQNQLQMGTLYSGVIFENHFPVKETRDRQEVLSQAQAGFDKYFNLKWYDPYGFENTYAFTVRKDLAEKENLKTISDLAKFAGSYRLGVDTSWLERPVVGYPAFTQHYGFKFKETFPMEIGLVYKAVANREVDVVVAYSTDPRLKEYDLVTLQDDKHFFPPYDASPVVTKAFLQQHPEVDDAVKLLVGKLDAQTIIDLTYEVDVKKRNEKRVAEEYLKKTGLLK